MGKTAFQILFALCVLTLFSACVRGGEKESISVINKDSELSFSQDVELSKDAPKGEFPIKTSPEIGEEEKDKLPTSPPVVELTSTEPISPTATLPLPAEIFEFPQDIEIVVLMGTDYLSPTVGRTDTIILLMVNRRTGSASLISVPRDLYVYRPGYGMGRINTVFAQGGPELLFETLEYNLGIRPEHWALAHLDDFVHFVNDLGGIDVQVRNPLLYDCGGVPAGEVHMDGHKALCYVRERRTSSDFSRSKRQLEVLRTLFEKFFTLDNIVKLPDWYARYSRSMKTDFGLLDLLDYLPFALYLQDVEGINSYQIGLEDVNPVRLPESGASVLLPDQRRIESILQEAVIVLDAPRPTSEGLATRLSWLTATPAGNQTPSPEGTQEIESGGDDKPTMTGAPTESP
jgi:LCP family protein required for cell wall assembly